MKKISIILISIVLLLLASSCDGQVFSELMDTETQTIDYTTVPLTLEFTANGALSFTNSRDSLKYTKNGGEKTAYSAPITVEVGDVVQLYADSTDLSSESPLMIHCSSECKVYGNVMSLLDSENYATNKTITKSYALHGLFIGNTNIKNHDTKKLILPATTLADYCYSYMFYGCKGLTEAPELPAKTLAKSCYSAMFISCTGLTAGPELPAMTLAESCYNQMFVGCTNLNEAPELPATTLYDNCYSYMFSGCAGLTKAHKLPATTLANYCYDSMFEYCTGLNEAPELPATTLASCCYSGMFTGCTGLTKAPELPATTLAASCYHGMFKDCTGLTTAPELPAATLAEDCYKLMFFNCTNLNSITCLATNISATDCTNNWLSGVADTGTFTKASSMTSWTEDSSSGIPSGWTVVDKQ